MRNSQEKELRFFREFSGGEFGGVKNGIGRAGFCHMDRLELH
jgi:hypothetical protein